jgi:hypothetical protein
MDLVGMGVLVGFVGIMLLVPFGILLGMALPRGRHRPAVSDFRQPAGEERGRLGT